MMRITGSGQQQQQVQQVQCVVGPAIEPEDVRMIAPVDADQDKAEHISEVGELKGKQDDQQVIEHMPCLAMRDLDLQN